MIIVNTYLNGEFFFSVIRKKKMDKKNKKHTLLTDKDSWDLFVTDMGYTANILDPLFEKLCTQNLQYQMVCQYNVPFTYTEKQKKAHVPHMLV